MKLSRERLGKMNDILDRLILPKHAHSMIHIFEQILNILQFFGFFIIVLEFRKAFGQL